MHKLQQFSFWILITQNFYQVLYVFLILLALVLCILFIYFLFEDLFFLFILLLFWTYSICMCSLLCLNTLHLISGSPELKKHQPLLLNLIHRPDSKSNIWNDQILNVRTGKESNRLHLRSKMQNSPYFHFYHAFPCSTPIATPHYDIKQTDGTST